MFSIGALLFSRNPKYIGKIAPNGKKHPDIAKLTNVGNWNTEIADNFGTNVNIIDDAGIATARKMYSLESILFKLFSWSKTIIKGITTPKTHEKTQFFKSFASS